MWICPWRHHNFEAELHAALSWIRHWCEFSTSLPGPLCLWEKNTRCSVSNIPTGSPEAVWRRQFSSFRELNNDSSVGQPGNCSLYRLRCLFSVCLSLTECCEEVGYKLLLMRLWCEEILHYKTTPEEPLFAVGIPAGDISSPHPVCNMHKNSNSVMYLKVHTTCTILRCLWWLWKASTCIPNTIQKKAVLLRPNWVHSRQPQLPFCTSNLPSHIHTRFELQMEWKFKQRTVKLPPYWYTV